MSFAFLSFFCQPSENRETSVDLKSMEQLEKLNNGNGQSYGYIVYRKKLQLRNGSVLSMKGRPRDLLQVHWPWILDE